MAARLDYGLRSNFNPFLPERGLVLDGTNVSGSNLFSLNVSGSNKFSVDNTGQVYFNGLLTSIGSVVRFTNNTQQTLAIGTGGIVIPGTFSFNWTSSASGWGAPDLSLYRDAASILAQRFGTTAQTFRLYNTYTDASNYERAVFDWQTNTNILTIGTQNAGTGSARDLRIIANNNTVAYFSASGIVTVNNSISVGNSTINTSITPTTATLINLNPLLLMGS